MFHLMFDVYGKKVNTSCSLSRVLDRYCGQANTSMDSHCQQAKSTSFM